MKNKVMSLSQRIKSGVSLILVLLGLSQSLQSAGLPPSLEDQLNQAPVFVHPGEVSDENSPVFANAIFNTRNGWYLRQNNYYYGDNVDTTNPQKFYTPNNTTGLVDVNGNIRNFKPVPNSNAYYEYVIHIGQNVPAADLKYYRGKIAVEWLGRADVRLEYVAVNDKGYQVLADAPFVAYSDVIFGVHQNLCSRKYDSGSDPVLNGYRVYNIPTNAEYLNVVVKVPRNMPQDLPIDGKPYVYDLRVWLSDGNGDASRPLRPEGSIPNTGIKSDIVFHPKYVEAVNQYVGQGAIRFMDFTNTLETPQQDFTDRRSPRATFVEGYTSIRNPLTGDLNESSAPLSDYGRTGPCYEQMIALCNATNKDLWINIPHLASRDYLQNLARLIFYGSSYDGTPYTYDRIAAGHQAYHPPLNPNLKVWVEYSNEIWNRNNQNYLGARWLHRNAWQSDADYKYHLEKEYPMGRFAIFNANKVASVWEDFLSGVSNTNRQRVVKVAATFTASPTTYTTPFVQKLIERGQRPDVVACTSYFASDMEFWVRDNQALASLFNSFSGYNQSSAEYKAQVNAFFKEWNHRLLSYTEGPYEVPSAIDYHGGIPQNLRSELDKLDKSIPMVTYEGGPRFKLETFASQSPHVLPFLSDINRHDKIKEVYLNHLNLGRARGLRTHMAFQMLRIPDQYGQWGHLDDYSDLETLPAKQLTIKEWMGVAKNWNSGTNAVLASPKLLTDATLPSAIRGRAYRQEIRAVDSNGNPNNVKLEVVGSSMESHLNVVSGGNKMEISGTPLNVGGSFVVVRATALTPSNSSPAWKVYSMRTTRSSGQKDPAGPKSVNFNAAAVRNNYANEFLFGTNLVTGYVTPFAANNLFFSAYKSKKRFEELPDAGLLISDVVTASVKYGNHAATTKSITYSNPVLSTSLNGDEGRGIRIEPTSSGQVFDLNSLKVGIPHGRSGKTGASAVILGFPVGGTVLKKVVNIPEESNALTLVKLDWLSLTRIEIDFCPDEDERGAFISGVVDDVVVNGNPTYAWKGSDLGSPKGSGTFIESGDGFKLVGGGGGLGDSTDSAYFVRPYLYGDAAEKMMRGAGTIKALVKKPGSVPGLNDAEGAQAGVTLRAGLNGAGPAVTLLHHENGVKLITRTSNGVVAVKEIGDLVFPVTDRPRQINRCWLKLERDASGKVMALYTTSAVGNANWQPITLNPSFNLGTGDVYAGLVVTSSDDNTMAQSEFQGVEFVP